MAIKPMPLPPYPPPYSSRKPSPPARSMSLNILPIRPRNRSLSVRSNKEKNANSGGAAAAGPPKHRFTMATLRGLQQPELSKKLFKLIKSENHVIGSYENASRERASVATQLSEWGESTGDESVSEISDKLGVLLSELGEQENNFAENLEEYRSTLKQIRNTESSVQPSRDHKAKVSDELQKLKYKDPQNVKMAQLEQELVRAEAENLVAEAQLTNITRQKLKEAYDIHFAAVIERAEKQVILARHGRRLLNLLDDTPMVPGDARPSFDGALPARQILNDAEDELRQWQASLEPVPSSAGLQKNLMPAGDGANGQAGFRQGTPPQLTSAAHGGSQFGGTASTDNLYGASGDDEIHPAHRKGQYNDSPSGRAVSGSSGTQATPYPVSEADSHAALV